MVRESQGICSDLGQISCHFLCFASIYAYHESNSSQIFLASLRSASYFLLCLSYHCVTSLHGMNRFKVALKACEMACIDLKLLHLYMDICPAVRESQGKFALKSQGKSGIFIRAYSWEPCTLNLLSVINFKRQSCLQTIPNYLNCYVASDHGCKTYHYYFRTTMV